MSSKPAKTTVPKTKTAVPAVAAPVKTESAVSAPRSKAAAASAPVSAPVVAAAPVVVAAPEEEVNLVAEFASQVAKVNDLRTALGVVLADMKKTEKRLAVSSRRPAAAAALVLLPWMRLASPCPRSPLCSPSPRRLPTTSACSLARPRAPR